MALRYILTVAVFITMVSSLAELSYRKSRISHAGHAAAFDKLLNSIAAVNQARFDSIKKMTKLQELLPYTKPSKLQTDAGRSESSDSSSEEKELIYLVIPSSAQETTIKPKVTTVTTPAVPLNTTETARLLETKPEKGPTGAPRSNNPPKDFKVTAPPNVTSVNVNETAPNPRASNSSIMSNNGLEFLSKSIERSCKNHDVKKCVAACKDAVKDGCSRHDCRKKLKKSLKKGCKRSCKDEFSGGW